MDNILLYNKLASLPDHLKKQVEDFIDALSKNVRKKHSPNTPKFGSGKNMFLIKPGFDDALEDFKEYMQ